LPEGALVRVRREAELGVFGYGLLKCYKPIAVILLALVHKSIEGV
jgi:hypothetical protein